MLHVQLQRNLQKNWTSESAVHLISDSLLDLPGAWGKLEPNVKTRALLALLGLKKEFVLKNQATLADFLARVEEDQDDWVVTIAGLVRSWLLDGDDSSVGPGKAIQATVDAVLNEALDKVDAKLARDQDEQSEEKDEVDPIQKLALIDAPYFIPLEVLSASKRLHPQKSRFAYSHFLSKHNPVQKYGEELAREKLSHQAAAAAPIETARARNTPTDAASGDKGKGLFSSTAEVGVGKRARPTMKRPTIPRKAPQAVHGKATGIGRATVPSGGGGGWHTQKHSKMRVLDLSDVQKIQTPAMSKKEESKPRKKATKRKSEGEAKPKGKGKGKGGRKKAATSEGDGVGETVLAPVEPAAAAAAVVNSSALPTAMTLDAASAVGAPVEAATALGLPPQVASMPDAPVPALAPASALGTATAAAAATATAAAPATAPAPATAAAAAAASLEAAAGLGLLPGVAEAPPAAPAANAPLAPQPVAQTPEEASAAALGSILERSNALRPEDRVRLELFFQGQNPTPEKPQARVKLHEEERHNGAETVREVFYITLDYLTLTWKTTKKVRRIGGGGT
ncbi:unnamed protein product [Chrysoparadoxa australica]